MEGRIIVVAIDRPAFAAIGCIFIAIVVGAVYRTIHGVLILNIDQPVTIIVNCVGTELNCIGVDVPFVSSQSPAAGVKPSPSLSMEGGVEVVDAVAVFIDAVVRYVGNSGIDRCIGVVTVVCCLGIPVAVPIERRGIDRVGTRAILVYAVVSDIGCVRLIAATLSLQSI